MASNYDDSGWPAHRANGAVEIRNRLTNTKCQPCFRQDQKRGRELLFRKELFGWNDFLQAFQSPVLEHYDGDLKHCLR